MLPLCRGLSNDGLAAIARLSSLRLLLLDQGNAAWPSCSISTAGGTSEQATEGTILPSSYEPRSLTTESSTRAYGAASLCCSHRPAWRQSEAATSTAHAAQTLAPFGSLAQVSWAQRNMGTAAAAAVRQQVRHQEPMRQAMGLSEEEGDMSADDYRAMHSMVVDDETGAEPPDPVRSFTEAGFPPELLNMVTKSGFTKPTLIQSQAWPIATAGRDLIAIASTGSGKTAGYLVPALAHIRAVAGKARKAGVPIPTTPVVLVLAPTRELACQIQAEATKFGAPLGLRTACLYGGAAKSLQRYELQKSPHIVIATPGRLLDFADAQVVDLSQVTYLVIDEADRMLDMGFEPQLLQTSRYLPRERQTLFFSATWPREVQQIADRFANNRPVKLFVGNVSSRPVAAATITQMVQVVASAEARVKALAEYLKSKPHGSRFIVFVNKKMRCDWLQYQLSNPSHGVSDLRCGSLHGDKLQASRDAAIAALKRGKIQLLIATDVAARGLDVPGIAAVINFDAPQDVESYVHRIGRTGRAGASGEALTFLAPSDVQLARGIARMMQDAGNAPPPELQEMLSNGRDDRQPSRPFYRRGGGGGGGSGGRGGFNSRGGSGWRSGGSVGGSQRPGRQDRGSSSDFLSGGF